MGVVLLANPFSLGRLPELLSEMDALPRPSLFALGGLITQQSSGVRRSMRLIKTNPLPSPPRKEIVPLLSPDECIA